MHVANQRGGVGCLSTGWPLSKATCIPVRVEIWDGWYFLGTYVLVQPLPALRINLQNW